MGKWITVGIVSLLGAIILWIVIASAIWGFGVATADIFGRGEAHKKIHSANFRMEAYDKFFNEYASIKGLEGQIDELTSQLNLLEPGTREYNLTLSSLTGTKGLRHTAIQKYNADAQKNWTEGQFRDRDLPYQIADTTYPPK